MHAARPLFVLAVFLFTGATAFSETLIRWEKKILETKFYAEGASYGDLNNDGKNDIVYGPFWFEGPDYTKRHKIYDRAEFNINGYSDNFFSYVYDIDGDGYKDVLVLGFPGKEGRWYKNPGKDMAANEGLWKMYVVADVVDNESPEFTDITGDGKPEIVCSKGGQFGYYEPDWKDPTKPWNWHPISDNVGVAKFTHGLGIGDVNGDGKLDLLEAKRWWEHTDSGNWTPHTFNLTGGGGAQMFAYDFTGSGRNDIVSSLNAHQFGIAWFENKAGTDGPAWAKHLIVGQEAWENEYGVRFSQPHAMALADVNGDGLKDIITGKRFWAHNGHDPNETDPKVLYWFETKRVKKGNETTVEFVPHLIDDDTGVGTQLVVGDIDGDGLLDVVVGNKYGCRVLLQRREEVSREKFEQFQPKKIYGPDHVPPKDYKKGQSANDAAKGMILPPGFKVDVIAAEPDVVQPIAMCWDERGRLWVAEGNSYPQKRPEGKGQDRILIFEDTKGNGHFDKRTVFYEGLNLVSGMEVGFGGVWIGAAPQLLFIPKDANDKAGEPQVLLDGWGMQDTHETLNSFIWGPDGWLYGCQGVFTYSNVGKPGAPDSERTPLNCCVWRYHPVRHKFEVFTHGTSNPWGLDYDEHGEFFTTACVIPHLYHNVPGGRYQRQGGQHYNPYTYDDIKTIANHAHFAGRVNDNAHWDDRHTQVNVPVTDDTDEAGGGHAHCGLCIYQGDNFPPEYRGELIFGNLHGHRLVHDHVEAKGSTFIGQHRADFMRSDDFWFIPIQQKVGPDGALYVSDWSDKQVCHQGSGAVDAWDRSNGRIYRIVYDKLKPWKGDLGKLSDQDLKKMAVENGNVWFQRMARKVLWERYAGKRPTSPLMQGLSDLAIAKPSSPTSLRALWTLDSLYDMAAEGEYSDWSVLYDQILEESGAEYQRGWAVRLAGNRATTPNKGILADFSESAKKEKSPLVRRELASLLQRLPLDKRTDIALGLIRHKEDAEDPVIPYLIWYGIEPVVGADAKAGMKLATASQMDMVTGFIYRRMSTDDAGRNALLGMAATLTDAAQREKTLAMIVTSAHNTGHHGRPKDWDSLATKLGEGASPATQQMVEEMSVLFGDEPTLKKWRGILDDTKVVPDKRAHVLMALVEAHDLPTAKILHGILNREYPDPLRRVAIQSLVALPDSGNAGVLLQRYDVLSRDEKSDAVAVLASTREGAAALLRAVADEKIEKKMLTPFLIRQLQTLKSNEVDALVAKVYGTVNQAKPDVAKQKAKWQKLLTPAVLKAADIVKGHEIFKGTCATCHRLIGEGASVGPDLTGSNRADLGYLLDNVLDPSAVIGKGYELNVFTMKDARVISGIMKEETSAGYKVAMPGGVEMILNKTEVGKREVLKISMMPEGQFDALGPEMAANLVAFLQSNALKIGALPAVKVEGAIEGEGMKVLGATAGSTKPQAMGGFHASRWSGGSQLWWTGGKPGAVLTLALPVAASGNYNLKAVLTKARDYGMVTVSLDGKPLPNAELDLYNIPDVVTSGELDWGTHALDAGEHKLEVKITGANPAAVKGYMFGLDYVKLEKK